MSPPQTPFQPYAAAHVNPDGPGDVRPTAKQVLNDCKATGTLTGRSILITGASSGIGVATAAALYETGAQLFLAARDKPRMEQDIDSIVSGSVAIGLPRPQALEMHLDSLQSVRKAAGDIRAKTNSLNTIINNAGIMYVPYSKTEDGFEAHLAVNHLSHFALFHELRPLLVQGAQDTGSLSRVISVSSSGHRFSGILFDDINFDQSKYDSTVAYGQSKTANIYMCNTLSRLCGQEGIIGFSVHPGVIVSTQIYRSMSTEMVEDLEKKRDQKQIKTAEQGAATTVWAAVSAHFENLETGGRYLSDVGEADPMDTSLAAVAGVTGFADFAYDEEKADRLWRWSCQAIGVPDEAGTN